jgi:uncharacterized protein YggE
MKDMYQSEFSCPRSNNYDFFNGEYIGNKIENNKMKVFGEGGVSAKPDIAKLVIGVTNEGKELEVVQQKNAKNTQQVINNIKSKGIPAKDIQTQSYTIDPQYDYIEGKQVFRGYRVSNILNVTIRDLEKVGAVIDGAVKAGANVVNNISFVISDSSQYYEQALKMALADAQSKAFAMSDKLKVRINPIPILITEQSRNQVQPQGPMSLKVATQVSTPIEAGENEIIAIVEAVFIYAK